MAILSLTGLFLLIEATHGAIVRTNLTLQNAVLAPDGFSRDVVTVDGRIPGTLISGNVGDEFQINVINNLTNTSMDVVSSVHWHGLFQKHTNDMDGVSWVTQCPIIPGTSFLYDFTPTNQSGTFWYHSHYSNQYCDGLAGPFIIYDPDDPYRWMYDVDDASTVLFLSEYYHRASEWVVEYFDGYPNATLFNGLGRNTVTPTSELQVYEVLSGLRYRYRLINAACSSNYNFSIDGHTLTVIEADGIEIRPYEVEMINILAGQRYSFILTANQPINSYWVRALSNVAPLGDANGVNSAILRYLGAATADEPTTSAQSNPITLNEQHLSPLTPAPAPGRPEVDGADVNINFMVTEAGGYFRMDNVTWVDPGVPVLLQVLSGATTAQSLLPNGSVYVLPRNKSVQISIPSGVIGGPHPIHLHGHTFSVVRSAGNTSYNFENPPVRDVVNMGSLTTDNVTIRFRTDNPGPWFLHCHIDWHMTGGFAAVFVEDPSGIAANENETAGWDGLCSDYNSYVANGGSI